MMPGSTAPGGSLLHLLKNGSFAALTVTQFLGAFNDNAFKQLVLLLSLSTALPWIAQASWVGDWGQSLGLALFAAPFVLFGVLTGSLADRCEKRRVMIAANAAEVVVMALGALAVLAQRFELVLAVLFLMGLQSAFFGPSKYGSIPEMTEHRDLSRANGWIQMTTSIAIVLGTALGGGLFQEFEERLLLPAAIFVAISTLGLISSFYLRSSPATAPERPLAWNPFSEGRRQWRLVRGDRPLVLSLFASAFFWLIGATLMLIVNQYGTWLGLEGGSIALLLTILSLGIGLGSFLAARLSGDRIESGLIPAGLLGMALTTSAVALFPESAGWLRLCLFAAGLSAGLFSIPIRALIQHLPAAENRGSVLGFSEVLDFVGIFLAAGLHALVNGVFGLEPPVQMAAIGALTLVFAAGSVCYTAEFALRFWLALVFRTLYRIRTCGIEHVPARGGALLVANHLSFVDAFLVSAAVGRPVRFMMYRDFFRVPLIGHFARWVGAIPVSSEDGRSAKEASIQRAAELLRQGELVCIFAEGTISRSGSLLGFRRGLERIARAAGAPILPVALDGVWGSIFSFEGGRFFWKRPKGFSCPLEVGIGPALPSDTPAWQVRREVQALIGQARSRFAGRADTLGERFLRAARYHRRRTALVDSSGTRLTYAQLLRASLALRARLLRELADEERVGILLPPGVGAVLATLAVTLSGKVPVHLNYSLGTAALADPIRRAGLVHVISSPRFLRALDAAPPLPGAGTWMIEDLVAGLRLSDKLRATVLGWLPAALLACLVRPVRSPRATATILFSSGSTGRPKGVVLSHGNILSNALAVGQAMGMTEADRLLGVLPFFHSFGFTATLWTPLLHGATAVFHPRPTEAQKIGELAASERVTICLATPTFYQGWMRRIPMQAFEHLRLAVVGAEKLQPRFADDFAAKYGIPLLEGYGCTELSPVVCVNLPDLARVQEHESASRAGTVGRPLPGVTVRIQDPETGAELPPGVEGSVFVTGPNVMQGYLDDPERTREVLVDGWYDTGDVGLVDRDGFLILTDRRSRFSKIGGEMVPQGRVEEELGRLSSELCDREGVESGLRPELAVTSVPDDRKGERLVVLHTALPYERAELVDALRASELPALFQPRPDQYFEVAAVPKLGTGKTDLKGLADLALDLSCGARR
jgi:acyl-[acyl-carrier-protein]-phospholipid O-acyltransferase/long-chain-fatty-acid--[acyl-carrier-protein] ligase